MQPLFSPLLSVDDHEHRTRLLVQLIVHDVMDGLAPLTPGLEIATDIDEDLRFPPAPIPAWNAIFQNVIANA